MTEKVKLSEVAFPIPRNAPIGAYGDYLISFYTITQGSSGTIKIGGKDWPDTLIITEARYDTFEGTTRFHYIDAFRNQGKPWPPAAKLITPQTGEEPSAKVVEGNLPVIYGLREITARFGSNNFPIENRSATHYIDPTVPSSPWNPSGAVTQSMWFLTGSEGDPEVLTGEEGVWESRVKAKGEPVFRFFDESQASPVQGPFIFARAAIGSTLPDGTPIENLPPLTEGGEPVPLPPPLPPEAQPAPEPGDQDFIGPLAPEEANTPFIRSGTQTIAAQSSDAWQVVYIFVVREEIQVESTELKVELVDAESTLTITLDGERTVWRLNNLEDWVIPVVLSPNVAHSLTYDVYLPPSTGITAIGIKYQIQKVLIGIDYGNYVTAVVNGLQAPTYTIRGKKINIPSGSTVNTDIGSSSYGMVTLPGSQRRTFTKQWCADPVWAALDILTEVFGYTLADIDYGAFWNKAQLVEAPAHEEVQILSSPIETVKPLLNHVKTSLIQINGIFTFPDRDEEEIFYAFGKGDIIGQPIVEESIDAPALTVIATWGDSGYEEVQRTPPPLGATETINAPYQESYRDAIRSARELLWPKEGRTVKVDLGPKGRVLRVGQKVIFDGNAPQIVSVDGSTVTLSEPYQGSGSAIVESANSADGIRYVRVNSTPGSNVVNISGLRGALVAGSPLIDQQTSSTPYTVLNVDKGSGGDSVRTVIDRDSDAERNAFLEPGNSDEGDLEPADDPDCDDIDLTTALDSVIEELDCATGDDEKPIELEARRVGRTTAELWIINYTDTWFYLGNNNDAACTRVRAGVRVAPLTNLEPGTRYRFGAYNPNGCGSLDNVLASTTFTTLEKDIELLADNIGPRSARLTLTNFEGRFWRYQNTALLPSQQGCIFVTANFAQVEGLEPETTYTFGAYPAEEGCTIDVALDTVTFKTLPDDGLGILPDPRLEVHNITATTANLVIVNWRGDWRYQNTDFQPSQQGCTLAQNTPLAPLTGLTPNTTYRYAAFVRGGGCDIQYGIGSVTFTTAEGDIELTADQITATSARLTLTGWGEQAWRYQESGLPGQVGCVLVPETSAIAALNGLQPDTNYIYLAFSEFGCSLDHVIASVRFTTSAGGTSEVRLSANDITANTATLELTGHVGTWSYLSEANGVESACSTGSSTAVVGGVTESLTGLTPETTYLYTAYSRTGCNIENFLASTIFTTMALGVPTQLPPRLVVANITFNSANLILENYTGVWRYQSTENVGTQVNCLTSSTALVSLTNLQPSTKYNYIAFPPRGCILGFALDSVTFSTASLNAVLTASLIGPTFAHITLTGWDQNWRYQVSTDSGQVGCMLVENTKSIQLRDLEPQTTYTYTAYTVDGCDIDNALASTTFTTRPTPRTPSLSVTNITETTARITINSYRGVWSFKIGNESCNQVSRNFFSRTLTGLTAGTTYTVTAWPGTTCDSQPTPFLDRVTFTTRSSRPAPEPGRADIFYYNNLNTANISTIRISDGALTLVGVFQNALNATNINERVESITAHRGVLWCSTRNYVFSLSSPTTSPLVEGQTHRQLTISNLRRVSGTTGTIFDILGIVSHGGSLYGLIQETSFSPSEVNYYLVRNINSSASRIELTLPTTLRSPSPTGPLVSFNGQLLINTGYSTVEVFNTRNTLVNVNTSTGVMTASNVFRQDYGLSNFEAYGLAVENNVLYVIGYDGNSTDFYKLNFQAGVYTPQLIKARSGNDRITSMTRL